MSMLVCNYTGIILKLDDSTSNSDNSDNTDDMLFMTNHPLADYNQVVKSFKYRTKIGDNYKGLVSGAILTVLRHHGLLRIVGDNAKSIALHANNTICKQANKTSQLLCMLHRLLKQESRLIKIAKGYKVRKEANKREFQFCLESCLLQGSEKEGMNEYFLKNLQDWVNDLLPPTAEELLMLASSNPTICRTGAGELDITEVELSDGSSIVVQYTDIIEAVKNSIEDEIYKRCRRMPAASLQRKLYKSITLMQLYTIYSEKQVTKLKSMVKERNYNEVVLAKAISMLQKASMQEHNNARRNKMFEAVAWLKASDIEFQKDDYALAAFKDVLESDMSTGVNTDSGTETIKAAESLKDRLARLALARSK